MNGKRSVHVPRGNAQSGRRVFHGARFVFLALLAGSVVSAAHAATALGEVEQLAGAGASALALSLLDDRQPSAGQNLDGWVAFERRRIEILSELGGWRELADRVAALPSDAPPAFARWARTERSRALLELGEAAAARQQLAELVWGGGTSTADLKSWRRLIIRSYLVEGARDDAYAAMVRFHQDYGREDAGSMLLRARVLLAGAAPAEAARLLEGRDGGRARLLLELARMRAGDLSPGRVVFRARKMAEEEDAPEADRHLAWAISAEAAERAGNKAARVIALEYLFGRWRRTPLPPGLFDFPADALWDAYTAYAETVGNREQLLLGDDRAWFEAAESTGPRYPIRTRSLYALLALRAYAAGEQARAHTRLVGHLSGRSDGAEIIRRLYLDADDRFTDADSVPPPARRVLIDLAIAENDLRLASRLQAGLTEPPAGADRVMWRLRRAKIFVLGGEPKKGARVLERLLDEHPLLTAEQTDRLVQVVFDLQTVDEHRLAAELFERLLARTGVGQLRRELLYWAADSYKALGEFREAGRHYLDSAMLLDASAMDPWAQTARYQGALALAEAGLTDDARRLLEALLKVTEEPGRRAVLRRDLQQLWLNK